LADPPPGVCLVLVLNQINEFRKHRIEGSRVLCC
jgi:hypothetical protein